MTSLRTILLVVGAVCAVAGLLFICQGLGYIHWPASSFMIDQRPWADRGAAIAVAGLLLLLVARRLPRR